MKRKFVIGCLVWLINLGTMYPSIDGDNKIITPLSEDAHHKLMVLATCVDILRAQGYSENEITMIFNNAQAKYVEFQNFITHVQSHYAQNTRNDVINHVVNKVEEEAAFYIKAIFIIKVLVIIAIIIVVYLLWNYFDVTNLLKNLFSLLFDSPITCSPPPQQEKPYEPPPRKTQDCTNQINQNQQMPEQSPQKSNDPPKESLGIPVETQSSCVPKKLYVYAKYDSKLDRKIKEQMNLAQSINCKPSPLPFDAYTPMPNTKPRGNRLFKEVIEEQFAYAKSIGLKP